MLYGARAGNGVDTVKHAGRVGLQRKLAIQALVAAGGNAE